MEKSGMTREQKIEYFGKLADSIPGVKLKGDTIPYTSLNGHMYSFLNKSDVLALKLPPDARIKFMERYKTKLAENYGIVQKEFVEVPDSLLKKTAELGKYFFTSYEYVKGLKPKPTRKK